MTNSSIDVDVLIAGGGPVGLTLAIDLAQRGVRCLLVERRPQALFVPKMELCNPRTMEIFRRLGLADEVRRRGYDADDPMDVVITTSMQAEPILRLEYPSANKVRASLAQINDGSTAREPYARISQYTLEPLLREFAEREPLADIRFGTELVDFAVSDDGVLATVRTEDGQSHSVKAQYLAGCDGASSTVRQKLGIELESFGEGAPLAHIFFESTDFTAAHPHGTARHFYLANPQSGSIVTQDRPGFYGLHANAAAVAGWEPEKIIAEFVGKPIAATIHHVGSWTPRLLVAKQYGSGRVFLAGDAAHQYIPLGGFGMNTGIVDATNLGWRLAACVKGWGGPGLLPSYLEEQHQIGVRNCGASKEATEGHVSWRMLVKGDISADKDAKDRVRETAEVGQRKAHEMHGVELGYIHQDSSIISHNDGEQADGLARKYLPSTVPGAHLPHFWLSPGQSVYDQAGPGFTLIVVGEECAFDGAIERAYAEIGAPFKVDRVPADAKAILKRRFILVRPDLHVVWRGDGQPPADLAALSLGFADRPATVAGSAFAGRKEPVR